MAYWGFEAERGTLKYRCPAAANEFPCQGRDRCPGGDGPYGRVVRIPLEKDRRLFTPLPRDSQAWKRAYNRRTAVERVNSRIDNVLGFEHHTIRGLVKMETRVGIALVVMLAMALGLIPAPTATCLPDAAPPRPETRGHCRVPLPASSPGENPRIPASD